MHAPQSFLLICIIKKSPRSSKSDFFHKSVVFVAFVAFWVLLMLFFKISKTRRCCYLFLFFLYDVQIKSYSTLKSCSVRGGEDFGLHQQDFIFDQKNETQICQCQLQYDFDVFSIQFLQNWCFCHFSAIGFYFRAKKWISNLSKIEQKSSQNEKQNCHFMKKNWKTCVDLNYGKSSEILEIT